MGEDRAIEIMWSTDAAGVNGGISGIVHEQGGMSLQAKCEDVELHKPKNREIKWKEFVAIYVMLECNKEK